MDHSQTMTTIESPTNRTQVAYNTYSRRSFAAMAAAAAAMGVTLPRFISDASAQTTLPASYNESPVLAARVQAGELPPVAERLPAEPLVVTPKNEIGTYGGTFYGAGAAPETTNDLQITNVTGLFRFSNDLSEAYPVMAIAYEFSPDFTSCTINLRQGVKWSDGQPFSAADMMFYFNDYQFNTDLFPTPPGVWVVGGETIGIEQIDDYTVRFTFARPNPAFSLIHYSAGPPEPWRARHFLEQFHIAYNPDADAQAQAAGYDGWITYFKYLAADTTYNYGAMDPRLPGLGPWVQVSNDTQRQNYERNPYYFKVDTAGNQLPYVDAITVTYASNPEVENLMAISGDLSVAGLDLQLINYPLIRDGEAEGDYTTNLVYSERGADVALAFNQNHPDPALQALFTDLRFRQAMSVAIDRNEINEIIFLGQGAIRQATVNSSASFFKQEWADAYAQYDPDLANSLLDELGLSQRDGNGNRLRPDGQPLTFQLEYLPQEGPKQETCELVARQWAEVGVQVQSSARERNYLIQRLDNSEQDATAWHVDRQLERSAWAYLASSKLTPGGDSIIRYCKPWRDWIASGGETGLEPPAEALELYEAFQQWQQNPLGAPDYLAAATSVYDLVARNLWVIGIIGEAPQPVIVKNNVGNVFKADGSEDRVLWGAANWFWHTHMGEQWYLRG